MRGHSKNKVLQEVSVWEAAIIVDVEFDRKEVEVSRVKVKLEFIT